MVFTFQRKKNPLEKCLILKKERMVCVIHLSDVEGICESFQTICRVWKVKVYCSLQQHLLVSVLVMLTMGGEITAVAPVFLYRHLKSQGRNKTQHNP